MFFGFRGVLRVFWWGFFLCRLGFIFWMYKDEGDWVFGVLLGECREIYIFLGV